jgi:hypothetical protein
MWAKQGWRGGRLEEGDNLTSGPGLSASEREEGHLGRVEELGRKEGWAAGVLTRPRKKKKTGRGKVGGPRLKENGPTGKREGGKETGRRRDWAARKGEGFRFFSKTFFKPFQTSKHLQTFKQTVKLLKLHTSKHKPCISEYDAQALIATKITQNDI